MPLIANTIIVTGGEVKPTPPAPVVETVEPKDHPVLIVNGKEKKVGKHSHYLLDMLTIEDDK